jgi:hypothetical protein
MVIASGNSKGRQGVYKECKKNKRREKVEDKEQNKAVKKIKKPRENPGAKL